MQGSAMWRNHSEYSAFLLTYINSYILGLSIEFDFDIESPFRTMFTGYSGLPCKTGEHSLIVNFLFS